ncbi:hypothetical protein F5H01DRAFT_351805 [Linnemannia elongata]|nr:hypothetical protein F5H01DRAFT_351805 [Linnemannia elongata]
MVLEAKQTKLSRALITAWLALQAKLAHTQTVFVAAREGPIASASVNAALNFGIGALPAASLLCALALFRRALFLSFLALTESNVLVDCIGLASLQLLPTGLSVGHGGDGSESKDGRELHFIIYRIWKSCVLA